MKQLSLLLLALALLPISIAGAGQKLTVFYSNDVRGKTEPCG